MKYPDNDNWRDCWKKAWHEKFKIEGFVQSLTIEIQNRHPRYKQKELRRSTIQSAITDFKKAEQNHRLDYFLKNKFRREAFLTILEMTDEQLEDFCKQIEENSTSFETGGMQMYPGFDLPLDNVDEGWIEPSFEQLNTTNSLNRKKYEKITFEKFKSLVKTTGQIAYVQASIGKTRLLEYLKKNSSGEKEVEYVYFSDHLSLNYKSGNVFVVMVEQESTDLGQELQNFYQLHKDKISLLVMVSSGDFYSMKLAEQSDNRISRFNRQEGTDRKFLHMEIKIDKKNGNKIISKIRKHLQGGKTSVLDDFQKLLARDSQNGIQIDIPEWCNTLSDFCRILKLILENQMEENFPKDWSGLLHNLLPWQIMQLLPVTLSGRKVLAEKLIGNFMLHWVVESLNINKGDQKRYSGSILLQPEKNLVAGLWKEAIIKSKDNPSEHSIRNLLSKLENPSPDLTELKEALCPWLFEKHPEKLVKIFLDYPLWQQESDRYRRAKEITSCFRYFLAKADGDFRDLYPRIAYYGNDSILEPFYILERVFRTSNVVAKRNFTNLVKQLPQPGNSLLILTAALACDSLKHSTIIEAWKNIFAWWNEVGERLNHSNEAWHSNEDFSSIVEVKYDFLRQFKEQHKDLLRAVSRKYREHLPFIENRPDLGERYHDRDSVLWFQEAKAIVEGDIPWNYDGIEEGQLFRKEKELNIHLEIEPFEWLAEKGKQKAIDILSEALVFRDPERCAKYIGKGKDGWRAKHLPSILVQYYKENPNLINWYSKLSFSQKQKFVNKLTNSFRIYNAHSFENAFSIVKQENPDLLSDKFIEESFIEETIRNIMNPRQSCDQSHLQVLRDYFAEEVYEKALDLFFSVDYHWEFIECYLDAKRQYRFEYSFSDLEVEKNILEDYITTICVQKKPEKIKNVFKYLAGHASLVRKLYSHAIGFDWVYNLRETSYSRTKISQDFVHWCEKNWKVSVFWSSDQAKNLNEQNQIEATIVDRGIKILQQKGKGQFSFRQTLQIIEQIKEFIENYDISYFHNTRENSLLNFDSLSRTQWKNYYSWLVSHIKNEKIEMGNYYWRMVMNEQATIKFLKDEQPEIYLPYKNFLFEKNDDHSIRQLLQLRDEEVLGNIISNKKELRYLLSLSPNSLLDKGVNHKIYFVNPEWWQWFWQTIENRYQEKWSEIFQEIHKYSFGRTEEKKMILDSFEDWWLGLSEEIQAERFLTYCQTSHTSIYFSWLLRLLQPPFQNFHEELSESLQKNFPHEHYRFFPFNEAFDGFDEIANLVEGNFAWLQWKDNAVLSHIWLLILENIKERLSSTQHKKILQWCRKQIGSLKKASKESKSNQLAGHYITTMAKAFSTSFTEKMWNDVYILSISTLEYLPEEDDAVNIYWHFLTDNLLYWAKKKDIQDELLKDIKEYSSKYREKTKSKFLCIAGALCYSLFQIDNDGEGHFVLLKETKSSPISISDLVYHCVFSTEFLNKSKNFELLEFYLEKYISPEDLNNLIYDSYYPQTLIDGSLSWETHPDQRKLCISKDIYNYFRRAGIEHICEIVKKRCERNRKERKLWFSLLNYLFEHHSQRYLIFKVFDSLE